MKYFFLLLILISCSKQSPEDMLDEMLAAQSEFDMQAVNYQQIPSPENRDGCIDAKLKYKAKLIAQKDSDAPEVMSSISTFNDWGRRLCGHTAMSIWQ